jgi:hypothetical protein
MHRNEPILRAARTPRRHKKKLVPTSVQGRCRGKKNGGLTQHCDMGCLTLSGCAIGEASSQTWRGEDHCPTGGRHLVARIHVV